MSILTKGLTSVEKLRAAIDMLADDRPFVIVDAHAHALIQCACGDVLSLSGASEYQCDSCTRKYRVELTVTEITHEEAQSVIVREDTEELRQIEINWENAQ